VNLYVPLRRQFIQLRPGTKTARVMTFPGTGPVPTHFDPNDISFPTESLPGQTIHGIYTVGTRITRVIPSHNGRGAEVAFVEEKWVSPDLKIVVLAKYGSNRSNETIDEIRELERSEPDAALFEIPSDYKVETVTNGDKMVRPRTFIPEADPLSGSTNTERR